MRFSTHGSLGRLTNRSASALISQTDGVITAYMQNAVSSDIYVSAPIFVSEPGLYTLSVYIRQFGNCGQADLSLLATASLDTVTPNTDIVLSNQDFYSSSEQIKVLQYTNINIIGAGDFSLKVDLTGKQLLSGGFFINIGEIILEK